MTVSAWAQELLGAAAQPVQDAVVVAIRQAHDDAYAAQRVSGTTRQDTYGHTLKNRHYECLAQDLREANIPGGVQVFRPAGVAFDLVRCTESNVVLFPWRFSPDQSVTHDSAKLPGARASAFRRGMLTVTTAEDTDQLSIDDAAATDEELAAQAAEFRDVEAQLRTMARVVTIGYASNFTGIFELGWGEASLNDDGTVTWTPWRDLTHLMVAEVAATDGQTTPGAAGRAGLRPVVAADDTAAATGPRFDDAPLVAGFGLQPRPQQAGEPQAEEDPKDVDVDAGDQSES